MKRVPATMFKAQCLAILDRIDPDGIIITKHGRPVAKLIPVGTAPRFTLGHTHLKSLLLLQ